MQNNDEALLSNSLASHIQLVKIFITFELHGILFIKVWLLIHFKVVFNISNKVK